MNRVLTRLPRSAKGLELGDKPFYGRIPMCRPYPKHANKEKLYWFKDYDAPLDVGIPDYNDRAMVKALARITPSTAEVPTSQQLSFAYEFLTDEYHFAHNRRILEWDEITKNEDSLPGWPYFDWQTESAFLIENMSLYIESWEKMCSPESQIWPSYLFFKKALYPREKIEDQRIRVIMCFCSIFVRCQQRIEGSFINALKTRYADCESKVGWSPVDNQYHRMIINMASNFDVNPFWSSEDASQWDQTLPDWLLAMYYQFIWDTLRTADQTPEIKNGLMNVYQNIVNTVLILKDGSLTQTDHSNPSGGGSTSIINAVANTAIKAIEIIIIRGIQTYQSGTNLYLTLRMLYQQSTYGDDRLVAYRSKPNFQQLSETMAKFGMVFKPSKMSLRTSPPGSEFCGATIVYVYEIGVYAPVWSYARIYTSILYPLTRVETLDEALERASQMLPLLAFSQHRGKVVRMLEYTASRYNRDFSLVSFNKICKLLTNWPAPCDWSTKFTVYDGTYVYTLPSGAIVKQVSNLISADGETTKNEQRARPCQSKPTTSTRQSNPIRIQTTETAKSSTYSCGPHASTTTTPRGPDTYRSHQ